MSTEQQQQQEAPQEARYAPSVARVYATDQIEVTWQPQYCIHFAACIRGSVRAFNTQRRPWVDPTAETPERMDEIVAGCPTGALHVRWLDGRAAVSEPADDPISVMPQHNGPLFIRGNLQIVDRAGNVVRQDTRMALCRCGHSNNKPFCDDSHYRVGFESNDPGFDAPDGQ